MLQRIQTIFLLLVTVCMILMLVLPIWSKGGITNDQTEMITINAFHQKHIIADTIVSNDESVQEKGDKSTILIAILAILASLIAIWSITKFNNRLTQIKLGALNSLLMAACLGYCLYSILGAEKIISPGTQGKYLLGFFMPVAGLLFNMLANRFIRKDEKLVRSVDRLR